VGTAFFRRAAAAAAAEEEEEEEEELQSKHSPQAKEGNLHSLVVCAGILIAADRPLSGFDQNSLVWRWVRLLVRLPRRMRPQEDIGRIWELLLAHACQKQGKTLRFCDIAVFFRGVKSSIFAMNSKKR